MKSNLKSIMKKSVSFIVSFALVFGLMLPAANFEQTMSKAYAATSLKVGAKGVLVRNTNLRTSPSLKGKVVSTAKKGTSLTVTKTYNSWYAVTLSNGKKGYMVKSNITSAPVTIAVAKPAAPAAPSKPAATVPVVEKTMVLATTTSTRDTGLLDYLIPIFEKKYNTSVKVISVGTGEAIEMGKRGDADVLLVHARSQEDAFVASGYGINRKDVMYNEFFIVGPKDDPAKISGQVDAQTAMKKIADAKATFISRGDKSGTNTKELQLWSKYSVKPQGQNWYMESGQGMGDTLTMAAEKGAYTLVDSGTWFAFEDKVNLKVVVKGDKDLFNPYGVIAVNPEKYPNVHNKAANAFIDYITSPEGQKAIAGFMKNGKQLFTPDAHR